MVKERTCGEIFVSRSYRAGVTLYWTYLAEKKNMKSSGGEYAVYLLINGKGKIDWCPLEALENLNWI